MADNTSNPRAEVPAIEMEDIVEDAPDSRPDAFLNIDYGVIGRTVSTKFEPNTSSQFHFWLGDRREPAATNTGEVSAPSTAVQEEGQPEVRSALEIGNIVAAFADDENDITFGTVVEMRSYSDVESFIADYLSHNFGDATVEVPTDIAEVVVVTCNVMRNLSSKTQPVGRSHVYYPSSLGIQFSYGILDKDGRNVFSGAAIPLGLFENGDETIAPISIDEDFLVGPEGAHLNISGISGLASKTSAAQFVMKSLLTHTSKRVAVVMFNVKSRDLLYVDQRNTRLEREEWSQNAYDVLEIPMEPFTNARFFAPADPNDPHGTQSLRELRSDRFEWDLQMLYRDIPSLFDSQDWDDKMEGVWFRIRDAIEQGSILTYTQMLRYIDQNIEQANQNNRQWFRGYHIATWNKMRSHLARFPHSYSGLIKPAGTGSDIPWGDLQSGSVFVVDIEKLQDRGKRLVFGRAMRELSNMLESGDCELDAIVVFVDELNKFAPSGNVRTPLKARLVDITARGRSVGLVLFGAEQFASSVEKEIVENSSTYLFGRTETNELRTPNYSAFSDEVKTKLTMLPQGQLLAKFAKFPQPIFVKFPHPPCLPGDQFRSG